MICNAAFEKLFSEDYLLYTERIKSLLLPKEKKFRNKTSIKDLLDYSFLHMENEYRNEYVYKVRLLSNFILKQYSLKDTIILNEFKIGNSIADMVLVNGTNKVFEIKTELDSPERLKTQLQDYYKGFSEVYIVTHHTLADKYEKILDKKIGLIVFEDNSQICVYREAQKKTNQLDNIAMMKSLRKKEFLKIIIDINGSLPQVTPVMLYRKCLELVSLYDSKKLQKLYHLTIKQRITVDNSLLSEISDLPDYLKFFCYTAKFNAEQYSFISERLSVRA